MATVIAVLALALILFLVIRYLVKEKRKGARCIGCPYAGECMKYSQCDRNAEDLYQAIKQAGAQEIQD